MAGRRTKGSIYDVAREAGVSIGTVSRVFNEKPDVAEGTRVRVLEAAKRVRYMPRISTRRINIGLVVQQIERANEDGFLSHVVATLAKHAALRGAVLELLPAGDVDAVYRNYVRGLIAVLFGPDQGFLGAIPHVPIVLINNVARGRNVHTVASDHAQGARLATEHLLARGHRRIGFLEIQRENWGAGERERGYREAFAKRGAKVRDDMIAYVGGGTAGDALVPLLARGPTALFVGGEDLSLEVSRILLQELKLDIPGDISVIGCEMPLVSGLMAPAQTTVAQPWEDMGRTAVEGILSMIHGGTPAGAPALLPNRLVERDSVRRLARRSR